MKEYFLFSSVSVSNCDIRQNSPLLLSFDEKKNNRFLVSPIRNIKQKILPPSLMRCCSFKVHNDAEGIDR